MVYMGSKSKIANEIVPIIQSYIDLNKVDMYIEPFVGGANVIDKIMCKNKYGSDINRYLIALLCHVRDGCELYKEVTKEMYSDAEEAYRIGDSDRYEDWEIGNIGFLSSYNGRMFEGYSGARYVKDKGCKIIRNYYIEQANNLLRQARYLRGTKFRCFSYLDLSGIIENRKNKMVVYCDPPYQDMTRYKMKFDSVKFWDEMREWAKYNIVLISELKAPKDFVCIWEKQVTRTINNASRDTATEKLFIHRDSLCRY